MADLTRRGFLARMSVATGVGVAGGLGLRQLFAPQAQPSTSSMPGPASFIPGRSLDVVTLADPMMVHDPMVVHVRDVPTGEVAMLVGTHELVYRDPDLVSRLVKTAASARRAEG